MALALLQAHPLRMKRLRLPTRLAAANLTCWRSPVIRGLVE